MLNQYQLGKQIYQSSFSQVYEAVYLPENQKVAVKKITSTQPGYRDIFAKEAEISRNLSRSPYFIPFFDAFEEDGNFYLVTRFIEGKSILEYSSQQDQLFMFFRQAVEGLWVLHQQGLVHCDVNPKNILITEKETLLFMDFGITLSKNSANYLNSGTLPYMSPEQLGYIKYPLGYYTDLYSLGVTFYQASCGTLPFSDPDQNRLIHKILTDKPKSLKASVPQISPLFSDILDKLMQKNPKDRYQSIEGLVYDLNQYKNQDKGPFILGKNDHAGTLQTRVSPIGLQTVFQQIGKRRERGLNLFIRGNSGSGKSTVLENFHLSLPDNTSFLFTVEPESSPREGRLLSEILKDLSKQNALPELSPKVQTLVQKVSDSSNLLSSEEIKTALKLIFHSILTFFSENHQILLIDNFEQGDEFSQSVLLEECGGVLIASINREWQREKEWDSLRFSFIDLLPMDESGLKPFLSELFNQKIKNNDLDFLCSKFLKYSFYPGEIIENLKILLNEKIIEFFPEREEWEIQQETIQKIDFSSFYQSYLQNRIKTLTTHELKLLKIFYCLKAPFELETLIQVFSILSSIPEEESFSQCLEMMEQFKKEGLIKASEEGSLFLLDSLKETLSKQIYQVEKKAVLETVITVLKENPEPDKTALIGYMREINHPEILPYLNQIMQKEFQNKNYTQVTRYYLWIFDYLSNQRDYLLHFSRFVEYRVSFSNLSALAPIIGKIENLLTQIPLEEQEKIPVLLGLNYYFFMQNNFPKSTQIIQELLPLAEKHENYSAIYICYSSLGAIYFFSSRVSQSESALLKGLSYSSYVDNKDKEPYNYGLLALVQAILGKKEDSLRHGKKSVELSRSLSLAEQSTCLHFSGYAHSHFGIPNSGIPYSLESIEIAETLQNILLAYSAYFSAGLGFMMREEFSSSEQYLQQSLALSKKMNVMLGLDWVYHIFLELDFRTRNRQRFEEHFNELRKLKVIFQYSLTYQLSFLKYQGIYYLFYNDYPSARETFLQALKHAQSSEAPNRLEAARIMGLLSYVYRELGEYQESERYQHQSETIFTDYQMAEEKKYYLSKTILSSYETSSTTQTTTTGTAGIGKSFKDNMAYESVLRATAVINSILDPKKLLVKLMEILFQTFGAEKGFLRIEESGIRYRMSINKEMSPISSDFVIQSLIQRVLEEKTPIILNNASLEYSEKKNEKSILVFPLIHRAKTMGVLYLTNSSLEGIFSSNDLKVLSALMTQTAIAIENAIHFLKEKEARRKAEATLKAFQLFVPPQFMDVIAREGIEQIRLGNAVEKKVSIFFSDIRDFTSISETLSPEDLMLFLNSYMEAIVGENISKNKGFIDKFIGDAVMAVFDSEYSDGAVHAAVQIQKALPDYNELLKDEKNQTLLRTGIGINTGTVIMGTVGTHQRMDSTIIGDEVNLASRLESLSKLYQVPIIVSANTIKNLKSPEDFHFREIDSVTVKGKAIPVTIYEVFSWEPEEIQILKQSYESELLMGITFYKIRQFDEAIVNFQRCLEKNPKDTVVQLYLKRCLEYQNNPPEEDWDGSIKLDKK